MSIPKRQHYVPRSYLEYWKSNREVEGGKPQSGVRTFNKVRNQTMFATDLNSISQVRYFNRLDVDQDVYDMLAYKYAEQAEVVAPFFEPLRVLVAVDEYKKRGEVNAVSLDDINKTFLEGHFTGLESLFSVTLNLINTDLEAYLRRIKSRQINVKDLLGIFAVQLFRTKHARELVSAESNGFTLVRGDEETRLSEEQKAQLLKAMMFVDSLLFADALGRGKFSIELLLADSPQGFITSSAPAIVLSKSGEGQKDLSVFEGFMPLGPSVGLIVRGYRPYPQNFVVRKVGSDELASLNRKTYEASSYDVYATYDFDGLFER